MGLQDGSGACFELGSAGEGENCWNATDCSEGLVCVGSGIVGNCYYQCDPDNPDCPFEGQTCTALQGADYGVCEPFGGTSGGGSGTGICPIVAEEAKAAGALVVGIVTTPFHVERRQRMARALEGLESLRRCADAVLVLDNNRLLHFVPNLPLDEAFSIMDQLVAEIVKGIVETITLPSLINLDFADIRAIMANGGVTMMLYGESDRGPEEVVHEALNHPLLDVDITGATGVLIHVTGGPYMTLESANQVVDLLTAKVSENANVIWGARQDAGFGDTIKVMAIITGVGGTDLNLARMKPDALGEALRLTRQQQAERPNNMDFQRWND